MYFKITNIFNNVDLFDLNNIFLSVKTFFWVFLCQKSILWHLTNKRASKFTFSSFVSSTTSDNSKKSQNYLDINFKSKILKLICNTDDIDVKHWWDYCETSMTLINTIPAHMNTCHIFNITLVRTYSIRSDVCKWVAPCHSVMHTSGITP